jgi:hypothetical protein
MILALMPNYLRAQMIDLNGNGMSDVWEWTYNAYGVNPASDPDQDGFSNLQESIAGTDPFNANSFPHITLTAYAFTNFSVTTPSHLGKNYSLFSVTTLGATNWMFETNQVSRSGTNMTLTVPVSVTTKFYRIAVSDVNSDGSGLMNDWEKYQLGLDPSNALSNGQEDGNGNPLSDYAYATNLLASQNVVSIAASISTATEPDPGVNPSGNGQFTITRGGFPLDSITVNLDSAFSGTRFATAGLDYSNNLPTSIVLPTGVSSTNIALTPMANTNLATPVLAQLQLLSGNNYTLGNSGNASVVIYPSPTASGSGLLGQYYTNSSITYTNSRNFNPTNLFLTRLDPVIDFNWTNGTSPNLSNGLYSVRWTGTNTTAIFRAIHF